VARIVDDSQARIRETIVTHMPKEAAITRIEFEGPRLAIYVKNVGLLLEQSYVVTDIVNLLHKRVVIRSDPSIRHTETESERLIKQIVPAEAEITEINFDPTLGEVIIEAKKPGLAIGKDGSTLSEIIKSTSWRPRVLRAPPLPSKIIASSRHILHSESEERSRIFRDVGERIFRPRIVRTSSVYLTPLGGFHEVGRSAILIETEESCVMMDCGISAGANDPTTAYPRVDTDDFNIDKLDAVIISHAHLDHCLDPDSYIQASDGSIIRIADVNTGLQVPAVDFAGRMQIESIKCIQRGALKAPKKMLEVRTKTRRVKTTPDHPFFTLSHGKPTTKQAQHLGIDDYIATVKYIDVEGESQPLPKENGFPARIDPETCRIIGYLLGDGTKAGRDYGQVTCTDKDASNLRTYAGLIRGKFSLRASIRRISDRNRMTVSSKRFREWLESIEPTILEKSPTRQVPQMVCRATRRDVSGFLRGLYDAEGSVEHHHLVLTTTSQDIAHKVQLLLLRFRIISHLHDHDETKSTFGGGPSYQLVIYDPASIKAFKKYIGFSDRQKSGRLRLLEKLVGGVFAQRMDLIPLRTEAILEIANELGLRKIDLRNLGFNYTHYFERNGHLPTRKTLNRIVKALLSTARDKRNSRVVKQLDTIQRMLNSDVMWEPVTSVIPIDAKSEQVYDLTVPGHSNYIANGIVVHNCGFVPFLYKYGYDGPIYCSEPTSVLMTLLQLDYLDVWGKEGGFPPYDQKDVREAVMHTIPVKYGVVTDVAPDIKLTLHNAGHIIGSSIVHLHIGEGLHNIVYSGDFKFGRTMLLEPATCSFPRAETLIMESTYGGPDDVMSDRETVEGKLAKIVNETAEKGGKILIPTLAVGRAQEIMLVLNSYMKSKQIKELPIFLEGMISEATAIHTAYPEYLARDLREQILYKDINPFQSDYFSNVDHPSDREKICAGDPAIILATSGMMEGGPAIDYFRYLAPDEKNSLIFVSYQVEGTLGNRLKNGAREVSLMSRNGKVEAYKVNLRVESVEGFSGHSDRNQLFSFLKRISPRPSRVVLGHGERRKTDLFAHQVSRILKLRTIAPDNLETLRLR
jgi:predicted metal-dependent RNase/intein/homing endonuclease